MTDLTLGFGVVGIFLIGVVLLGIWYFGKKDMGRKPAKIFKWAGVICVLLAFIVYAGVPALLGEGAPAQVADQPAFDVAVTESEGEVTVDSSAHEIMVAMIYNTTSNAFGSSTGVFTLNWTISRADVLLDDAIAHVAIGSVPEVDIAGASDEYIVDQNADDTFNALWTKAGSITAYEDMNVLVEAGGSAWATVVITINGDAVHEMDENDMITMSLSIAGETWDIIFLADSILT